MNASYSARWTSSQNVTFFSLLNVLIAQSYPSFIWIKQITAHFHFVCIQISVYIYNSRIIKMSSRKKISVDCMMRGKITKFPLNMCHSLQFKCNIFQYLLICFCYGCGNYSWFYLKLSVFRETNRKWRRIKYLYESLCTCLLLLCNRNIVV